MEEVERNHINQNLSGLVDNTNINTGIIAQLIQTQVFGDDDIADLDSIPNQRQKTLRFYQLVMTKNGAFVKLKTALSKTAQSGALKILEKPLEPLVPGTSRDQTWPIRFEVDNHVHFFTGRDQELTDLHKKLQETVTPIAIVGLGGVGKTELARCYIQKYLKLNDNVIWINAETEQTLAEDFRRLATNYLKLPTLNADRNEKEITAVIQDVYSFFIGKRSIFVFDNAKSNKGMQTFLPFRVAQQPLVLITSRFREWSFSVQTLELVDVPQMEKREAIDFVKTGLKIQENSENRSIEKLVKRLQCHPLALTQAISNIKQKRGIRSNYKIEKYLELFEYDPEKLLNSEVAELIPYGKTTLTTWKVTTDDIAATGELGRKAVLMCNIMSYFKPDKIPTTMLISHNPNESPQQGGLWSRLFKDERNSPRLVVPTVKTEDENEDALHLLGQYSMIKLEPTTSTISVHRLVQEVARIELKKEHLEESFLRNALTLLSRNTDPANYRHVFIVFKYSIPYSSLIDECKKFPQEMLDKYKTHSGVDDDSDTEDEMNEELQEQVLPRERFFYHPNVYQNYRILFSLHQIK